MSPQFSTSLISEPKFFSPQVDSARRFYLNLQPSPNARLAVVCGGLEYCHSDYYINRRTFLYYSIECVVQGMGKVRLQNETFNLSPGMIFSYGPDISHEIVGDPNAPMVKYFVDFIGQKAPKLLYDCKLSPGRIARIFPPNALVSLYDELIHSGLQQGTGKSELCVKLVECLALKIAKANAPLESHETLAFATYQQCRRHIERNFISLRNLREIAMTCGFNKAYLCRLFRRFDQQSPYQLLLRLKVNHAATRLQQDGTLVKQAAEEVGFTDPFHFSRVFKGLLGVSPDKFRRIR